MTALQKVDRRILLLLLIVFVFNQLDRVNISFAALQMNADLGLTTATYATGVSLFFVSYLLFEIPSNLLMQKFGARRWLSRITISWGLVACAAAFMVGPRSFWSLRFLLGLAEAGFVPGLVLYLNRWLPEEQKCAAVGKLCLAIPIAVIIGSPLSAALLQLGSAWGMSGWRWIFLVQGFPSIVLGIVSLFILTETPREASWLSAAEQEWLAAKIAGEQARIPLNGKGSAFTAVSSLATWSAAATFFCASIGTYGIIYWLPQVLKQMSGLSNVEVSLLSALPFVATGLGMYVMPRHADLKRERHGHFAVSAVMSSLGLIVAGLAPSPGISFGGLLLAGLGLGGAVGVFWAIPMGFLTESAGTIGFALINTVSSSAGLVSPLIIGWIRQRTGSFQDGLYCIAGFMALSAVLVFFAKPAAARRPRTIARSEPLR